MSERPSADYDAGDVAVVEGRVAIYIPTRWEWMDGTWTAIPISVGPVLFNVHDAARAYADLGARVLPPDK